MAPPAYPAEVAERRLLDLVEEDRRGKKPWLLMFFRDEALAATPGPWVLSQWWPAPFHVDGMRFVHAEQFMMYAKAQLFGDEATARSIVAADTPAAAKQLGRQVRGFDEQTWVEHRFDIVVRANLAKFGAHQNLRRYLTGTAPAVPVEVSPFDRVWGIRLAATDENAKHPSKWRGKNLLGFALEVARSEL